MLAKRFLVAGALCALVACGDGNGDGVDAPSDDADGLSADGGIDGMPGPCPGQLAYQAEVLDWVTGQGIFEATATEVGNEGNTATSAPNGRVQLCLPLGMSDVRIEADGYLPRTHRVYDEPWQLRADANIPAPALLITPEDANELYLNLTTAAFDPNASHALVDVRYYASGEPVVGATVGLGTEDPSLAYARGEDGSFAPGNVVSGGGVVLFANVPNEGEVGIGLSIEGGYVGQCDAAGTMPLIAGEFTYTLIACQN